MRIKLFIITILLLFAFPCYAEDFYVAQSAAGTEDGSSCANAKAITWFNTAGSWGDGASKISGGDTVHFCGTLTSTATIQGSGSEGNIITLIFEAGAKFSTAVWGIDGSSAIYASSKNYFTIDGNSVGVIENTDNGDALGTQDASTYGISLSNCTYATVQNLTIQNMYVHASGGTVAYTFVRAINVSGGGNITITGNTIPDTGYAINVINSSGTMSTVSITNNTVSACSKCISTALGGDGAAMDAVTISGNTCQLTANWYDEANNNHGTCLHVYGRGLDGTSEITNLSVFNNYFYGDISAHGTSHIYLENCIIAPSVYNNLLVASTNIGGNGFIYTKGNIADYVCVSSTAPNIYNNTMVGFGTGSGIMLGRTVNPTIKNNIIYDVATGINDTGDTTGITSNYNDFYSLGAAPFALGGVVKSLVQWQAAGYDANSITDNPLLAVPGYTLLVGSPADGAGTATGQLSANDKAGTAWATPPAIGAYEFVGEVAGPWTLGVVKVGNATITSSPAGISCGATCTYEFADTTEVTLTAVPDAWYRPVVWSGDCAAGGTVTMSAGKTCVATMERYYAITIGSGGSITIGSGGTILLGE